ncbi:3583_t:CDS:1 [Dentiscutata erythropus]|uniref:3583_t:CDS:1 n=1 Tax=Dentiscutata erythropus TaxID=1348616 RepID=A0A9N9H4E1_9GLOM|nr:3583_t:CDS:1 [Dentiscutata erythropus]
MASQDSKEFSCEVSRLVERGLSILPKEFSANELAQNFNDKIPNVRDIYNLVVKLKVKRCGNYDDSVVDRIGELLWFTVSEKDKNEIQEQYANLTNRVIEVLTPVPQSTTTTSTSNVYNELSLDESFYIGITDYVPPTNSDNQPPDSMDMIGGITPQTNRTNR